MTTVVLVSCVKGKDESGRRMQAQNLYTSDWFKKARAFAELLVAEGHADTWAILSAKHGLIAPTKLIGSYEKTVSWPTPIREARAWAKRTAPQIARAWPGQLHLIFLAGERYRLVTKHLPPRVTWDIPMQGLDFFAQRTWLKERIS